MVPDCCIVLWKYGYSLSLERLAMKPINQNPRFSIHVILLALVCFAMIPSAMAGHIRQSEQDNTDEQHSNRSMADMPNQRADHQKGVVRQLMVADSTANETVKVSDNSESGSDEEADMQARRQKMIDKCKANRGIDCERQVDTELEAQQLDSVHTSPPEQTDSPGRPRPRPRASP